jgi:enoyl-CoA hydratase/carnithine racemase
VGDSVRYETSQGVATLTLDRPGRLNAIVPELIDDLEATLDRAEADAEVRVVRLRGAGRSFCAGYDIEWGAAAMEAEGAAWDPMADQRTMRRFVDAYMRLWRSPKPVIAQVHGYCVGGGSDFALCADLVIASEDAVIGTPYSRMWGAYLSGMWIYRLGLARTKFHALTGRPLNGRQAADVELINEAVPFAQLEDRVAALAAELTTIPSSQLAAMGLVVNHAYENMGLASTQTLGPILDGLMRNTPDAHAFIERAATDGVRAAIEDRDGPFGDYSQAPPERQPDPGNVIEP